MRGADEEFLTTRAWTALYPRVRGADDLLPLGTDPGLASTPACVGLTRTRSSAPCRRGLYPRMREADLVVAWIGLVGVPLPPHTRG